MLDASTLSVRSAGRLSAYRRTIVIATAFTRAKTFLQDGVTAFAAMLTPQVAYATA